MVLKFLSKQNRPCIKIELTHPVYLPGQPVTGHVLINTTEPFIFTYGSIVFKGTKLSSTHHGDQTNAVVLMDMKEYFCRTQELFENKREKEFPIGEHAIPFSLPLPDNIPDSFKGDQGCNFGRVRYFLKVKLYNPYFFVPTYKHECEVIVARPYNGPIHPISIPVVSTLPSIKGSGRNDTVNWCVTLEKNVWKIGEVLELNVFVDESVISREINSAFAHLTHQITALPDGVDTDPDQVQFISCTSDTPQDKKSGMQVIRMNLPDDLQPTFNSDRIRGGYYITVYLDVPSCKSAMVKIPIILCRSVANEVLVNGNTPESTFDYLEMMQSNRPKDAPPAYHFIN
jgi:hypothetical protein